VRVSPVRVHQTPARASASLWPFARVLSPSLPRGKILELELPCPGPGARAAAERNSPVRYLPATAGELVVAYGTRVLSELCRQSIEYARAWTERGLPGRLLPVDGADHFTILDALAQPEGVLMRALLAMLGR
jgi:hypothetical protein